VNAFFSLGNRSAAVRIPKYANQADTARVEFRPPDASGNVYLMLAAMLLAGLDGIRNKIDPQAGGFGPIDQNIFAWSDEKRAQIKSLPASLNEALHALEADHTFLTADGVFNEELIHQWVDYKRNAEYFAVRDRPHPYEMSLYFDV
jgi:glutamine synthetase